MLAQVHKFSTYMTGIPSSLSSLHATSHVQACQPCAYLASFPQVPLLYSSVPQPSSPRLYPWLLRSALIPRPCVPHGSTPPPRPRIFWDVLQFQFTFYVATEQHVILSSAAGVKVFVQPVQKNILTCSTFLPSGLRCASPRHSHPGDLRASLHL